MGTEKKDLITSPALRHKFLQMALWAWLWGPGNISPVHKSIQPTNQPTCS